MSNTGTGPIVSFDNVSKHYGSLKAVERTSLELAAAARRSPSSARTARARSTSLDMLLALRKPTSGKIRMFGNDPYHAVKSGEVGAMLQSGGLMPEVTVRELVTLVSGSLHPRPVPVNTTLRRAEHRVGGRPARGPAVPAARHNGCGSALAIVGEVHDLIVLDEPTTAMDVETRQRFWATMKEEVAEGKTLLFATHYLEEADQAADRVLVINRGRLLADGSPDEIKKRAGNKRMSFRLVNVNEPFLLGLPGIVSLETRHDLVHIQTSDFRTRARLYALLDSRLPAERARSRSGGLGLEQAFYSPSPRKTTEANGTEPAPRPR